MTDTFDPAADAASNYTFAWSMLRLGALLDGDRHPQPDEPVDLYEWTKLMRARDTTAARRVG